MAAGEEEFFPVTHFAGSVGGGRYSGSDLGWYGVEGRARACAFRAGSVGTCDAGRRVSFGSGC